MSLLTGKDIIEYRYRRGLTIEDLASIVGMSVGDVTQLQYADEIDETTESIFISIGVIPNPNTPTPTLANIRKYSNSEIQAFKRCRRKWYLSWYRGLAPKQVIPIGVVAIGSRLHGALEVGYMPGGPYHDKILDTLEYLIREDRKIIEIYDDETKRQFESEADLERRMLAGYVDWLEETGADSELEVINSETYVERPINPEEVLIGKLDVQIRDTATNRILFMDHKSVGSLTQPTLRLNEQLLHYMTLLDTPEISGSIPSVPAGGLYNMLKRSKRTERAKPPFYHRIEVLHNHITLQNFWRRLMGTINDIKHVQFMLDHQMTDTNVAAYPTPSPNCSWDCAFFKICGMFDDGSRVEDAISDQYEVVDPLAYYERKIQTNAD